MQLLYLITHYLELTEVLSSIVYLEYQPSSVVL